MPIRCLPLARRGGSLIRVFDGIRVAIPSRWLELPIRRPSERSELQPCLFRDSNCPCPLSGQSSLDIYQYLVHRLYRTPAAIQHWQVYLYRDSPWTQAWKSVAAARLSTAYTRDVVFKLLHRVLPSRSRLSRWALVPTRVCTVCGVPDETLLHVFDRCPHTRTVLNLVSSLFPSLSPKKNTCVYVTRGCLLPLRLSQSTSRLSPVGCLSLHLDAQERYIVARHIRSYTPSSA